jgi:hypothetical protein
MHIKDHTDKRIAEKVKMIKYKKDLNNKNSTNKNFYNKKFDKTSTFRYTLLNSINIENNIPISNNKKNSKKELEYTPSSNTNLVFSTLFLMGIFIISSVIVLLYIKIKGFENILDIISKLI